MNRIIEACYHMQRYIERNLPKAVPLVPFIWAQMCHESGWGKSKLSIEANNFGGMKYRGCTSDIYVYTDWEGQTENYESAKNIEAFPNLYFAFIGRSVYKGWYDHAQDGIGFIKHLESCGWCASTPGKKTYSDKIFDLMKSQQFSELIKAVNQRSAPPSWLRLYDMEG